MKMRLKEINYNYVMLNQNGMDSVRKYSCIDFSSLEERKTSKKLKVNLCILAILGFEISEERPQKDQGLQSYPHCRPALELQPEIPDLQRPLRGGYIFIFVPNFLQKFQTRQEGSRLPLLRPGLLLSWGGRHHREDDRPYAQIRD